MPSTATPTSPTTIALLTAAATTLAAQSSAQTIAWWRLDERPPGSTPATGPSVLDDGGSAHHGTPSGAWRYAEGFGSRAAADFAGNQGRVLIDDSSDFHLRGGFTLEGYLMLRGIGPGCCSKRYILFRGDRRAGADPWFLAVNLDGSLLAQVWDGAASHSLNGTEPIPLDRWVHVAATYDADARTLRLYLEHEPIGEQTDVPPPAGALDPTLNPGVAIGNSRSTDEGIEGIVDELRISSRALDPGEMLPAVGSCRPDLDGNGDLTLFDFLAFANLFDLGSPLADYDGDGSLTVFDFLAFQNAFDAGCP